jgi:uncharacterized protein DUF2333
MEKKKKRFTLVRAIIGIMLLAAVVWVVGRVFGFFGQPEEIRLSKPNGQIQPAMVVSKAEPDTTAHGSGQDTHNTSLSQQVENAPDAHAATDAPDSQETTQGAQESHDEVATAPHQAGETESHASTEQAEQVDTHAQPELGWDGSGLSIDAGTPSRKAIIKFKQQHHDTDKLLYLYSVKTEADHLLVTYPGKLLVDPDETPLEELITDTHGIPLTIAPQVVREYLNSQDAVAMAVVDAHKTLTGIVATDEVFAELKERQSHFQVAATAATAATAAEATQEKAAPEASEAPADKTHAAPEAAHAPAPDSHQPASAQHAAVTDTTHDAATQSHDNAQPDAAHKPAADHGAEATHGAQDANGEGHAAALPTDLPRGVVFIDEAMKPLHHELKERWWGWRVNDIINVTDNVNNYQLGVLEVTRRTSMILAERISRTGITASFDPNLESAMNWFMIKPGSYWFPSAESKYLDALDEWRQYRERLKLNEAKFYNRSDNLIPLLMAYEDLLGSCEENLVKHAEEDGKPVSFFKSDDYIFYAKGVVGTMSAILEAIAVDFNGILVSRRAIDDLHHAVEACHHALHVSPWVVFDSDPSSMFANHRANMAAPLSHARFYLNVIIKALST